MFQPVGFNNLEWWRGLWPLSIDLLTVYFNIVVALQGIGVLVLETAVLVGRYAGY